MKRKNANSKNRKGELIEIQTVASTNPSNRRKK